MLTYHGRGNWYESYAEQLQEREPHQTTVEATNVLEQNEVPDPKIGDHRKAGEKGQELGPVFDKAPEKLASVKISRRFGQDQVYSEKGKRDRNTPSVRNTRRWSRGSCS